MQTLASPFQLLWSYSFFSICVVVNSHVSQYPKKRGVFPSFVKWLLRIFLIFLNQLLWNSLGFFPFEYSKKSIFSFLFLWFYHEFSSFHFPKTWNASKFFVFLSKYSKFFLFIALYTRIYQNSIISSYPNFSCISTFKNSQSSSQVCYFP